MKPEPKKKLTAAQQIENARLYIVEQALVAFLEDVDNRVPTDAEILEHGHHVQFADTPLSVHEQDGKRFTSFYLWRRKHAVALGFLNRKDPLEVTSSHGFIISFEYLNAIREIFEKAPMSVADYDAAVERVMKLGRETVIEMHRDAIRPWVESSP
jgi:hypothetical protein